MPALDSGAERAEIRASRLEGNVQKIAEWWETKANDEAKAMVEKAREYDGLDLEIMGVAMQAFLPDDLDTETRRSAGLQLACYFYALGKLGRAFGAFRQGRLPKQDTPHDLKVYAGMIEHIAEFGRWT